jgi:hypothetical protein
VVLTLLDGLQLYLKRKHPGLIDGYTPEQRSLCLGLPFGGLKQEMQQSRTK